MFRKNAVELREDGLEVADAFSTHHDAPEANYIAAVATIDREAPQVAVFPARRQPEGNAVADC
ncbi:MAG: hypothetical protein AB8B91_23705 [Rubripirellula sp.]